MTPRRILSDAQIDEMAELREQGWSSKRIANHFTARGTPISRGSIDWQCLRFGADLPTPRRGRLGVARTYSRQGVPVRAYTPEDDARLLELEGQGLTIGAIATALGRRHNSVLGRLYTLARHHTRQEEAHG